MVRGFSPPPHTHTHTLQMGRGLSPATFSEAIRVKSIVSIEREEHFLAGQSYPTDLFVPSTTPGWWLFYEIAWRRTLSARLSWLAAPSLLQSVLRPVAIMLLGLLLLGGLAVSSTADDICRREPYKQKINANGFFTEVDLGQCVVLASYYIR